MADCVRFGAVVAWAKLGSEASLDPLLEIHAESCGFCRRILNEVIDGRALGEFLPVHAMSPERREALRFALMAEVRQRPASMDPPTRGRGAWPRARAIVLAVAAMAAVVAGGAWARTYWSHDGVAFRQDSRAQVQLLSGAVGAWNQSPPDEIYRLVSGEAEFQVQRLSNSERFRVLAGDGSIEVRGTRFRASVSDQRLERVSVSEGSVWVWIGGALVAKLSTGDDWERVALARRPDSALPPSDSEDGADTASGPEKMIRERPGKRMGSSSAGESGPLRSGQVAGKAQKGTSPAEAAIDARSVTSAKPERASDVAFEHAWRLLKQGRFAEAAVELDALSNVPALDPSRRADVLYWAAQAHARARNPALAEARARRLLREHPAAFRAPDAALVLGEAAQARGDRREAQRWFERAAESNQPSIRARAQSALEAIAGRP